LCFAFGYHVVALRSCIGHDPMPIADQIYTIFTMNVVPNKLDILVYVHLELTSLHAMFK
jgi:hypothetical protein